MDDATLLSWIERGQNIAALFVAIGVAAEFLLGFMAGPVRRRLEDAKDAEVLKLTHDAAALTKEAADLRKQVEDERTARFEAEKSQLELMVSMNRAFQRTGNRTLNPFAFHAALKGKPSGHVTVLVNIDGGEPHQFAWQIWDALQHSSAGWSAEIKQLKGIPPEGSSLGMVVRCRELPRGDWHTNPKTACDALLGALSQGTQGFANVANAGSAFISESDGQLADNQFVIEVYAQPKALADVPNKQ